MARILNLCDFLVLLPSSRKSELTAVLAQVWPIERRACFFSSVADSMEIIQISEKLLLDVSSCGFYFVVVELLEEQDKIS